MHRSLGVFEATRGDEPPPRGRRRLQAVPDTDRQARTTSSPRWPAWFAPSPATSTAAPLATVKRWPRRAGERHPELYWAVRTDAPLSRADNWRASAGSADLASGSATDTDHNPWPYGLVEIGDEAAWSVSSAKAGNGVDMLRDGNTHTFYQSDGTQPHTITIQFQRRVKLCEIRLYLDYRLDESYTPSRLGVRLGSDAHDLREALTCTFTEPRGWVSIRLPPPPSGESGAEAAETGSEVERSRRPSMPSLHHTSTAASPSQSTCPWVETLAVQLVIYSNHQNGRDSHIRQVALLAPREHGSDLRGVDGLWFQTVEMGAYATVR
eukprot:ctg_681.g354